MGQHRRPGRSAAPGHPALLLLLSMGAAIVVTAVTFGSAGLADGGGSPGRQTATAATAASSSADSGTSRSTVRRPTLELRWTHGQSWVRVTDHKGAVLINDIYSQGTVKRFTAPTLHVEIGNAGAVTMIDKGAKPRIAGKTGQVAKSTVTGP